MKPSPELDAQFLKENLEYDTAFGRFVIPFKRRYRVRIGRLSLLANRKILKEMPRIFQQHMDNSLFMNEAYEKEFGDKKGETVEIKFIIEQQPNLKEEEK